MLKFNSETTTPKSTEEVMTELYNFEFECLISDFEVDLDINPYFTVDEYRLAFEEALTRFITKGVNN